MDRMALDGEFILKDSMKMAPIYPSEIYILNALQTGLA
jgi:hypothetical protein